MRLIHDPAEGSSRTLASDVELADSLLDKAVGLMGRSTVPEDYALAFRFGGAGARSIHTLFVRTAIDVCWTVDDEVRRVETLPAWRGHARARADTVYELAAGSAADVEPGDGLRLVE